MPEISVIIPCFNQGQYIDEAVESVLAQSYKDFEIIIVNDGSTDEYTNQIIRNYDRPKTKVIQTLNQGLASARNRAIKESNGKYILPLDADDKIGTDYLSKAFEIFHKESNIGIIYCEAVLFGDRKGKWNIPDYNLETMLLRNFIFASAFFRKEDWKKVGGYNPNMKSGWEDWDFWLSIIELGKEVYKIPETLFFYRIKKQSMNAKLTKNDYIELHAQLYYNHKDLYSKNIKSIFKEIYDIKSTWSYKIGRAIKNPLRLYEKIFRI